ncbi:MAG: hypothetical protein AB1444_16365 [Spirochaetota bacterium]
MPTLTIERTIYRLEKPLCSRFLAADLVSSLYYVYSDTRIDIIAEEFIKNENIFVCAVVNSEMKVCGVLVRKELFEILGRRFGRELYYNKTDYK